MRLLLAVTAGGALGSAARWLLAGWAQRRTAELGGAAGIFPVGTLAVNLVGCFLVGCLATLFEERLTLAPATRVFVLVGLLGGFTTFSTFGYETIALLRAGGFAPAMLNVGASVLLGLAGVWLGMALGRAL
jgi:fluoride exporter